LSLLGIPRLPADHDVTTVPFSLFAGIQQRGFHLRLPNAKSLPRLSCTRPDSSTNVFGKIAFDYCIIRKLLTYNIIATERWSFANVCRRLYHLLEEEGAAARSAHEISSKRDAKVKTSKTSFIVYHQTCHKRNILALLVRSFGLGRRRRRLHVVRRSAAVEAPESFDTDGSILPSTANTARSASEHSVGAMDAQCLHGILVTKSLL
jgi:hypothetical protein